MLNTTPSQVNSQILSKRIEAGSGDLDAEIKFSKRCRQQLLFGTTSVKRGSLQTWKFRPRPEQG